MNLGFPRGSVSLVGLELKSVVLPRSSPEAGTVGCFLSASILSEGASVGLSVALKGGEVARPDGTIPALPGLPVTLFGGKGFLRGGEGLGGKGGRRVPGTVAGFFVTWVESTDTAPGGFGVCLTPGLMCGLSGSLGLTGVVYNLCGARVVFANSVDCGILVVMGSWVDWSVSASVCSSSRLGLGEIIGMKGLPRVSNGADSLSETSGSGLWGRSASFGTGRVYDTSGLGNVFGLGVTRWGTFGAGCVSGILGRGGVFGLGGVRGICLGARVLSGGSDTGVIDSTTG